MTREQKLERFLLEELARTRDEKANHRIIYSLMWEADKAGVVDAQHPKTRDLVSKALWALVKRGQAERIFTAWGEAFVISQVGLGVLETTSEEAT